MFGLWRAMDLIRNLLKLAIISKSISRWVEPEQKFVTSDSRECNNESIMLGCPAIDDESSDKQLTMLGICQWQREGPALEVGSSPVVG
jgi:hypothetical protein